MEALSRVIEDIQFQPKTSNQLFGIIISMQYQHIPQVIITAVEHHYNVKGIDSLPKMLAMPLSSSLTQLTSSFLSNCQLLDFKLQQGLDEHHWLMDNNPRPALLSTLKQYPPGTLYQTRKVDTGFDVQKWLLHVVDSLALWVMTRRSSISKNIS